MQQGRIHGNPVADGWAGVVMRKPLAIQRSDGPTETERCRKYKRKKKKKERKKANKQRDHNLVI